MFHENERKAINGGPQSQRGALSHAVSVSEVRSSKGPEDSTGATFRSHTEKFAYSVKEVALLTSRATSSVWEDIRNQKFPVVRIGGRVLVLQSDLLSYLESLRDWSGKPQLKRGPRRRRPESAETQAAGGALAEGVV